MNNELKIKKCLKCGKTAKIISDYNCKECEIICCGEKMQTLKPNSTDAVFEKHVPTYEVENGTLKVKVNHVMVQDHYIEWICLKTKNKEEYVYLKPNEKAVAIFKDVEVGTLYAYCNKHGLWNKKIEK